MKKIILIAALVFLCTAPVMANAEGFLEWVTDAEHVYDYVYGFDHGLAGVRRGGDVFEHTDYDGVNYYENNYHGVINDKGEEIIPCQEGNIEYGWRNQGIGNGYAWTIENGQSKVYDYNGTLVRTLPFELEEVFDDTLFVADNGTNNMLVDIEGNIVVSESDIYSFTTEEVNGTQYIRATGSIYDYLFTYEGELAVKTPENYNLGYSSYYSSKGTLITASRWDKGFCRGICIMDITGNTIIGPDIYKSCSIKYDEGIIICDTDTASDYYSLTGQLIYSGSVDDRYIKNGLVLIKSEKKLYNILTKETVLDLSDYNDISYESQSDLIKVKTDSSKYGALDLSGKIVIDTVYSSLYTTYMDGLASGEIGNTKYRGYAVNGKLVIPLEANSDIRAINGGYFYYNGKIYNPEGNLLCDIDSDASIYIRYDGYIEISKNGLRGLLDISGREILPIKYDSIDVEEDCVIVKSNEKYGAYDMNGNEILPIKYGYIYQVYDTNVIKVQDYDTKLYGLVDLKGNTVLPMKYSSVQGNFMPSMLYWDYSCFIIEENDKYGLFNTETREITRCLYDGIWFNKDKVFAKDTNGMYRMAKVTSNLPVSVNSSEDSDSLKIDVETNHVNPVNVISAFYKDGIMVKTETNYIKDGLASFDVDTQNNDADSYKIFVWDMSNMFPYTAAISGPTNE